MTSAIHPSTQRVPPEEIHNHRARIKRRRRRAILDRIRVRNRSRPLMIHMIPIIHKRHQILQRARPIPIQRGIVPRAPQRRLPYPRTPQPVPHRPRLDKVRDVRHALPIVRAAGKVDRLVRPAVEDQQRHVRARGMAVERQAGRRARGAGDVDVVRARHGREGGQPRRRPRIAREVVGHEPALRLARGVHPLRIHAEPRAQRVQHVQREAHVVHVRRHVRRALPVAARAVGAVGARGRVRDDGARAVEEGGGQEVQVGLGGGRLGRAVEGEDEGRGRARVVAWGHPVEVGPAAGERGRDARVEGHAGRLAAAARGAAARGTEVCG